MTRKVIRKRYDIPAQLCAGELDALGRVLQSVIGEAADILYIRRRDPRFEKSAARLQDECADGREWAVLYAVRSGKFTGLVEVYEENIEPTIAYPAEEHDDIYVVLLTGVGDVPDIDFFCEKCGRALVRCDDGVTVLVHNGEVTNLGGRTRSPRACPWCEEEE